VDLRPPVTVTGPVTRVWAVIARIFCQRAAIFRGAQRL